MIPARRLGLCKLHAVLTAAPNFVEKKNPQSRVEIFGRKRNVTSKGLTPFVIPFCLFFTTTNCDIELCTNLCIRRFLYGAVLSTVVACVPSLFVSSRIVLDRCSQPVWTRFFVQSVADLATIRFVALNALAAARLVDDMPHLAHHTFELYLEILPLPLHSPVLPGSFEAPQTPPLFLRKIAGT